MSILYEQLKYIGSFAIFRGYKPENTIVRCGEYDARSDREERKHQDQVARYISIHPAYNKKTLHYDYALVHTKSDFVYDDDRKSHIYPVCLPDNFHQIPPFEEGDCYVMGYGKDGGGK